MDLRYQNGRESQHLFCVFITFFRAVMRMACQVQKACQPKKNFFTKKGLTSHMAIWYNRPLARQGGFYPTYPRNARTKSVPNEDFFSLQKSY
jgi:hypothetical protein